VLAASAQDRARTNGARNYGRESHARGGLRGAEQNEAFTTKAQSHEAKDAEAEKNVTFLPRNFFVEIPLCLRVFVVSHLPVGKSGSST
jgi:hypothetical protein